MTAIGYARVSTAQQAASGLGLEDQVRSIHSWAERETGERAKVVHRDEGVSGAKPVDQRPGLLSAIEALSEGDVLVVAKRDRLGRDVLVVALIERLVRRKGAAIVSTAGEGTEDDSPASIMMRQMLDVFAQFERCVIAERTKRAQRARVLRGDAEVPFGLSKENGELVECQDEQGLIRSMREWKREGQSYRAIISRLSDLGIDNRGRSFFPQQIKRLIAGTTLGTTAGRAP